MIILESRLVDTGSPGHSEVPNYKYVEGYFLTIHDLGRLVRDFQADNHDGFVSNDHSYIEHWLKDHNRI